MNRYIRFALEAAAVIFAIAGLILVVIMMSVGSADVDHLAPRY